MVLFIKALSDKTKAVIKGNLFKSEKAFIKAAAVEYSLLIVMVMLITRALTFG